MNRKNLSVVRCNHWQSSIETFSPLFMDGRGLEELKLGFVFLTKKYLLKLLLSYLLIKKIDLKKLKLQVFVMTKHELKIGFVILTRNYVLLI